MSHTTLASYENGTTVPSVDLLAALADVYQRPLAWFFENRESLTGFRYQNISSRVPLKEQRQFEAMAGKWADAYMNLRRHLKIDRPCIATNLPSLDGEPMSPENMAVLVRRGLLDLDDDQPVRNVVHLLEMLSAWAMEIKAPFRTDGAVARHGAEYFVILNPDTANDRLRLNAAHEVARLVHEICQVHIGWSDAAFERRAYVFATELLLPHAQLVAAFDGRSFLKLIKYKEQFGISLAAMIFRAEQSRIINTTAYRWLLTEMAKRGWRSHEPGFVWRDRAIDFETTLECATQKKLITWQDAERITGIREAELRQKITGVMQIEEVLEEQSEEASLLSFEQVRITV